METYIKQEFGFTASVTSNVVERVCKQLNVELIRFVPVGTYETTFVVRCDVRNAFRLGVLLLRRSEPTIL